MEITYRTKQSIIEKAKSWFAKILIRFGSDQTSIRLLLKQAQIFSHLDENQLGKLARSLQPSYYGPNTVVFKEGEIGDVFYLVKKGAVAVFTTSHLGQEIILARLEEGNYFGEQALLSESPGLRVANAKTLEETILYTIPHSTYLNILNPEVRNKLREIGQLQLFEILKQTLQSNTIIKESFFKDIEAATLQYNDGETIFNVREKSNFVYFVILGRVIIRIPFSEEESTITELGPGELFGELGVLNQAERMGTATAKGSVTLLAIEGSVFKKMYEASPELQQLTNALQMVYHIQHRGSVSLTYGTVLNMKAMIATYHLNNGDIVSTAKVLESPIFTISSKGVSDKAMTIQYTRGTDCKRTLVLVDRKIRGCMSIGNWAELSVVCDLVLNDQPISEEQIIRFKKEGRLTDTQAKELSPIEKKEILCHCMSVSKGKVYDVIAKGVNRLDDICRITGAGNVCGCCRPKIVELLGLRSWITVSLLEKLPLAEKIFAFRFQPKEDVLLDYEPGQHIIIQALIDNRLTDRAYTLTSVSGKDKYLEITVKKEEQGYFSPWLFEKADEKALIRVSNPQGKFLLVTDLHRPIVFFAAGVGITPAIAFARYIAFQNREQILHIDYSSHHEFLLKNEWEEIALRRKNITIQFRTTGGQDKSGRLTKEEVLAIAKNHLAAIYYICGPRQFEELIVDGLTSAGIALTEIRTERFVHAGGGEVH